MGKVLELAGNDGDLKKHYPQQVAFISQKSDRKIYFNIFFIIERKKEGSRFY